MFQEAGFYKYNVSCENDVSRVNNGTIHEVQQPVNISKVEVIASSHCVSTNVTFDLKAKVSEGNPVDFSWDFGDGTSSTSPTEGNNILT